MIEYTSGDERDLEAISGLWQKLLEHHVARSTHFAAQMSKMTFERRRQGLIDKAGGGLLVDLARDAETNQPVGYCVTTISDERVGEIDSIYVEREYRRHRIADTLMKRALSWLDGHSVLRRVLTVAGGNEQVLEFYARYGFYPRSTVLEQITERPDLAKT